MKLTNKEKNRISQLYTSKLELNESKLIDFRDRVLQILKEDLSLNNTNITNPQSSIISEQAFGFSSYNPYQYDSRFNKNYVPPSEKEILSQIHTLLDTVSLITGFIPLPITQVVSIVADLVNAGIYLYEGNYYAFGLACTMAATSYGVDQGLKYFKVYDRITKSFQKTSINTISKKLADKTSKLTPSEVEILKDLLDNKDEIIKTWTNEAITQTERYLKNPKQYKEAYWFVFKKDMVKLKWNSPQAIQFYKRLLWNKYSMSVLTAGGVDLAFEAGTHYIYTTMVSKPLSQAYNSKDYLALMTEFGGDVYNSDDVKKLEKAFYDKRIQHIQLINGKPIFGDGFRPSYEDDESDIFTDSREYSDISPTKHLPCDLIPSQLPLDEDHPCVKNGFWKMITKAELKEKKLVLPYVYKKIGNDYYYADPKILDSEKPIGTWLKITDTKNKDFLEKQIFPQFK